MPPKKTKNLAIIKSTRNQGEFAELVNHYSNRFNIVAEGDSWFAFPPKWLLFGKPSNVISHIKEMKRFNLLEMSSSGDEAVDMLSGKSKFKLIKIINRHHIHFLLFSGGGNDVVGRYDFDFFLRDNVTSTHFEDYLDLTRLDRRIAQIEYAYRDLIAFCDEYSMNKEIKIVTHCYDYAIPDAQGAEFVGGLIKINKGTSWMYPYLKAKNVPEEFYTPIAKHLIDSLADMFLQLESENIDRLIVADTRNTLTAKKYWLNEIHPNSRGFGRIADVIFAKMKDHF